MQCASPHGQDFPLRTAGADQHHGHFTYLVIHLCHQPQLIRPARQAFHIELAKWTLRRCLGRLIIFPALKPSCGIHPRILIRATDIHSPTRIFAFPPSCLCLLPFVYFATFAVTAGRDAFRYVGQRRPAYFNFGIRVEETLEEPLKTVDKKLVGKKERGRTLLRPLNEN